jgi:myo-inositol-1(or 4)-monophosphatase
MTSRDELPELARLALGAAEIGAAEIRSRLPTEVTAHQKTSPRDLVTKADLASEQAIIKFIQTYRPSDAILSEETGELSGAPSSTGVRWIVDPLDGTANFVRSRSDYAVAVGVAIDGKLAAGAIVRPATGEWAVGCDPGTVVAYPRRPGLHSAQLDQALVSVSVSIDEARRPASLTALTSVLPVVQDFRRSGSTSCDLLDIATGQLDAYIGVDTRPWDLQPGQALVAAAGGVCHSVSLAGGRTAYIVASPSTADQLANRLIASGKPAPSSSRRRQLPPPTQRPKPGSRQGPQP